MTQRQAIAAKPTSQQSLPLGLMVPKRLVCQAESVVLWMSVVVLTAAGWRPHRRSQALRLSRWERAIAVAKSIHCSQFARLVNQRWLAAEPIVAGWLEPPGYWVVKSFLLPHLGSCLLRHSAIAARSGDPPHRF